MRIVAVRIVSVRIVPVWIRIVAVIIRRMPVWIVAVIRRMAVRGGCVRELAHGQMTEALLDGRSVPIYKFLDKFATCGRASARALARKPHFSSPSPFAAHNPLLFIRPASLSHTCTLDSKSRTHTTNNTQPKHTPSSHTHHAIISQKRIRSLRKVSVFATSSFNLP